MRDVVILSAARTIGGSFGGSLKKVTAPNLGAGVIKAAIERAGIEGTEIDQTVFANAWQGGVGPNPARLSAVYGGVPVDAPAVSVNVRCGSSIQAMIGVRVTSPIAAVESHLGGTGSWLHRATAARASTLCH